MAGKRKPAIELGIGIGDDVIRMLSKALGGGAGKAKKAQANRVVSRLSKSHPQKMATVRAKAGKLEGQLARSKTKRRAGAETERMSKAHMTRMSKSGRNWDGSYKKRSK